MSSEDRPGWPKCPTCEKVLTMQEMRVVARRVVRSEMRRLGIEPETASVTDAERVLDEITNTNLNEIVAYWWINCRQDSQTRLWREEWREWQWRARNAL